MFRDGVARLLVFRVGAERFATRRCAVDEVIDAPAVQRDARCAAHGARRRDDSRRADDRVRSASAAARRAVDARWRGAAVRAGRSPRRRWPIDDVYDAVAIDEPESVGSGRGAIVGRDSRWLVRRGSELDRRTRRQRAARRGDRRPTGDKHEDGRRASSSSSGSASDLFAADVFVGRARAALHAAEQRARRSDVDRGRASSIAAR